MIEQPTVFLVDDDAAVRDALSLLLSLKGLRTQVFANAETFLGTYQREWRGCLLTDLRMSGMSGLELQKELAGRSVNLPVVVLTAHGDVSTAKTAMKAGAVDFLEKPVNDEILMDVLLNAIAIDARRHQDAAEAGQAVDRLRRLTRRERDVVKLVARGFQNREIAEELSISPRTVEVYKARMMEKLDCRSLADLLKLASRLTLE